MSDLLSPTFDTHRRWIEDIITTPESEDGEPSLMCNASPTEHVLRGSKSWAARSFRSRASGHSLRVPSNKENRSTTDVENSRQSSSSLHAPTNGTSLPVLGEIIPNGQILRPPGGLKFRPSPTPSLKKKKAEAIVKAHGSPQHVRVTAGGRIVPSEQSPLCHPRYGYSAIKTNGGLIKFAPNHPTGKAQWTQATQNGFVAQDVNGRLCQIVNGTILPLNEVDGALRLYVPAPNLNISTRGSSFGPLAQGHNTNGQQRSISQTKPPVAEDPPLPAQTNALELEYSKLELELKELDKTEALHGRTMAKTAKDALISKRRELVVTMDNIRKAIKSIKSAPRPEVPQSLPPMREDHQSLSPPRNRLPAFLQQHGHQGNDMAMPPFGPDFNNFFGMGQVQPPNGHYGAQTTPPPDAAFNPPYAMSSFFTAPPPFDGSMATSYGGYGEALVNGIPIPSDTQPVSTLEASDHASAATHLPQTDGTNSVRDIQRISSPRHSRAIDIKAPEPKNVLKSSLNPMSPAYKPGAGLLKTSGNTDRSAPKPVKDRAPTPLSPLHQLRPTAAAHSAARVSDGTISPTKKSPHLHSSSISSFETADFFPRNTREYSSRRYAYPQQSDDKENMEPQRAVEETASSPITPPNERPFKRAPPAPAVTPVSSTVDSDKKHRLAQTTSQHSDRIYTDSLPDRQADNVSPKHKRKDFVFIEERPSQYEDRTSSSPEKSHHCQEELCTATSLNDQIDFSDASSDWIEGYRAGLARRPVDSDRHGDFLDGYCAGLLKSKAATHESSSGSLSKSATRRYSPATMPSKSSSQVKADGHESVATRPPLETSLQSMDTLKEAVLAPNNEDAILTPSAEGPHANDAQYDLGAWARQHGQAGTIEKADARRGDGATGFPFPHRTSSMMERQGYTVMREHDDNQHSHPTMPVTATDKATRDTSITSNIHISGPDSLASSINANKISDPASSYPPSNRVSSMISIDSNIYRQWPGYRVFSPHLEWKSASSVAEVTGLAAGHFTSRESKDTFHTAQQQQRVVSMTSNPAVEYHGRFKEGSLDGVSNPPTSPQPLSPPFSPSASPRVSPGKESKKKQSPSKSPSPAKVKFEHIAEKVGIKVSANTKEDSTPSNTPPGKRNWRNVWRGGARKDSSKDDSIAPLLN